MAFDATGEAAPETGSPIEQRRPLEGRYSAQRRVPHRPTQGRSPGMGALSQLPGSIAGGPSRALVGDRDGRSTVTPKGSSFQARGGVWTIGDLRTLRCPGHQPFKVASRRLFVCFLRLHTRVTLATSGPRFQLTPCFFVLLSFERTKKTGGRQRVDFHQTRFSFHQATQRRSREASDKSPRQRRPSENLPRLQSHCQHRH